MPSDLKGRYNRKNGRRKDKATYNALERFQIVTSSSVELMESPQGDPRAAVAETNRLSDELELQPAVILVREETSGMRLLDMARTLARMFRNRSCRNDCTTRWPNVVNMDTHSIRVKETLCDLANGEDRRSPLASWWQKLEALKELLLLSAALKSPALFHLASHLSDYRVKRRSQRQAKARCLLLFTRGVTLRRRYRRDHERRRTSGGSSAMALWLVRRRPSRGAEPLFTVKELVERATAAHAGKRTKPPLHRSGVCEGRSAGTMPAGREPCTLAAAPGDGVRTAVSSTEEGMGTITLGIKIRRGVHWRSGRCLSSPAGVDQRVQQSGRTPLPELLELLHRLHRHSSTRLHRK
ncbi:hypothetical protein EYF80_020131 [Liparis tanakae]|uniref:Uncharacterized protein n=1 Tax=Liparis tanakae TaxID=230148 RepID=A0A4Z2HVM5_9TELE|nr:hypothetical protein EYF80_020131 [Liparis tanakae]